MLSLLHCQGLSGGEEQEDCSVGQIQPCDCLLDDQLPVGTQVCGLDGMYDACECDSDGNGEENERSQDRAEGAENVTDGGEGGEGGSGDEGTSSVDAELLIDPESTRRFARCGARSTWRVVSSEGKTVRVGRVLYTVLRSTCGVSSERP